MQWIDDGHIQCIREFVCGLFAGIVISGKTREEVLEGENCEYWFNWNCDIEVHIYKDDETDEWCCRTYQCNDYSQFFGNESLEIDLGDEWK